MKTYIYSLLLAAVFCTGAYAKTAEEATQEAIALEQQAIQGKDWYQAAKLYEQGAKIKGLPEQMRTYMLTRCIFCYLNQNHFAEAAPHVKALAEKGDPAMMSIYGEMMFNGLGVDQNRERGIEWMRKAARLGQRSAQQKLRQLGLYY